MVLTLQADGLLDLFDPKKHPRDESGQFAKGWSQKAIASEVDASIRANLSPGSQQYLDQVHSAARDKIRATNNSHRAKNDPSAPTRDISNAQLDNSLAKAKLYDLIGNMADVRQEDLFAGHAKQKGFALRGSDEQIKYVNELMGAMDKLRAELLDTPNQWERSHKPVQPMLYVPNEKGKKAQTIADRMNDAYKEVVKLTGFQVKPFELAYQPNEGIMGGSLYDPRTRTIELDPIIDLRMEVYHEFAHLVENDNDDIAASNRAFLKNRSFDGELHQLGRTAGYEDAFCDRYVGTVYPKFAEPIDPDDDLDLGLPDLDSRSPVTRVLEDGPGGTEALSIGLEYFASPYGMAKLYSVDPEHFNYVVGQIATAKRKGTRIDSGDEANPLVSVFSRLLFDLDPGVLTEGWSDEEIISEGNAAVGVLVEAFNDDYGMLRTDAIIALPNPEPVVSYYSQLLAWVGGVDSSAWDRDDILKEGEAVLSFLVENFKRQSATDILIQPASALIPQAEVFYLPYSLTTGQKCGNCFAYIADGACQVVAGLIQADGRCDLWESAAAPPLRTDDNQRVQRVLDWHGLALGIQYLPGDMRHNRRLTAAYGHVRGTYGQSDDGMAIDVWVNLEGRDSDRCFKLQQLTQDGEHDEYKYILGVTSVEQAQALYTANMPKKLMGRVEECAIAEVKPRRGDSSPYKWRESNRERDEDGRFAKKAGSGADSSASQTNARVGARFRTFENDLSPARRRLMEAHQKRFDLSTPELQALALYCGNDDYIAVNGYLKGETFEPGSVGRDTAKAIADTLSLALQKLPPLGRDVELYRGESWPLEEAKQRYQPGAVITNDIFTSTSYDKDQTPGGNVQIEIEAAAGGKGRNVAQFALLDRTQKEVLFDKGTQYEVLSVQQVSELSEFDVPTGRAWQNEWTPASIFKPVFEDGDEENEPVLKQYGIEDGSYEDFFRRPYQEKYRPILEDLYGRSAIRVRLKEVVSDRADAEFDESQRARDSRGRFARNSSTRPIGTPEQRQSAGVTAPRSLFVHTCHSGQTYGKSSNAQTKNFIKTSTGDAFVATELLTSYAKHLRGMVAQIDRNTPAFNRVNDEWAKVIDAASFYEDSFSVMMMMTLDDEDSNDGDEYSLTRTTEDEDGQIIQVGAIYIDDKDKTIEIRFLGSSPLSAPRKHQSQLETAIEYNQQEKAGEPIVHDPNWMKDRLESHKKSQGFASGAFLEGVISESYKRGFDGRITCSPIGRNYKLIERAGFKSVPNDHYELTPENAKKFWEMRQMLKQRQDSITLQDAIAWDAELTALEEEDGPLMCGRTESASRADAEFDEKKHRRANDGRFGQKNRLTTYSPDVHRVIQQGEALTARLMKDNPEGMAAIATAQKISLNVRQQERTARLAYQNGEGSLAEVAAAQNEREAHLFDVVAEESFQAAVINLRDGLIRAYGMTRDEALMAASFVKGEANRQLYVNPDYQWANSEADRDLAKNAARGAHQDLLTEIGINPRIEHIVVTDAVKRSHYDPSNGEISIGLKQEFDNRTHPSLIKVYTKERFFHEAGHALEQEDSDLQDACQRFIRDRALEPLDGGEDAFYGPSNERKKMKSLRLKDVFPRSEYKEDEKYIPGQFITPYVGKIYYPTMKANGSDFTRPTEIISMGLERFAFAHTMQSLLAEDPDHFFLVMGAIAKHREVKRRRDAEAEGDRADGVFNWKEEKHVRDENGRFATKPSAKNAIAYAGDEGRNKIVRGLADEIASIHSLPTVVHDNVQTRVVSSSSSNPMDEAIGGRYNPQYGNEIELWTSPANFVKGNTFAHEYGHHVDSVLSPRKEIRPFSFASFRTSYAAEYLEMFADEIDPYIQSVLVEELQAGEGAYSSDRHIQEIAGYNPDAARRYQFISDSKLAVERIMGRARNSKEVSRLRDAVTDGYIELPNGLRKETDRRYCQYLLNPTEVFARSYSQWVATRGLSEDSPPDNPKLFEGFGEELILGSRMYPTVWGEDNFKDIHNGFEDGFWELGMLKKGPKFKS